MASNLNWSPQNMVEPAPGSRANWPLAAYGRPALFLLATLLVALGLKLHYRQAAVGELSWILSPTATLVQAVSGVPFEFETGAGWISRAPGFIIAPQCAGINFLIISALSLSLMLLAEQPRRCTLKWWLSAHLTAYAATVLVNTLRILLSLAAPTILPISWLSAAAQHRWSGVLVYLAALWMITRIWRWICIPRPRPEKEMLPHIQGSGITGWVWIPPAVYLLVALGVPLATAPWKGLAPHFGIHGMTVAAGCLFVWGGLFLLQRHLARRGKCLDAAETDPGRPAAGEWPLTQENSHGRNHSDC